MAELPEVLAGLGSRVLVCTGASPGRHAGLLARLGLPARVFPVAGEPTIEVARAGAAAARKHRADVIAAIGGGSVIDTGKAVAMLAGTVGIPWTTWRSSGPARRSPGRPAPCVAVPTTAGTGAEVTANAVLAAPEHGLKASLRSPLMIPRVALVDPELTLSCPAPVTAASGLDALTQCLEPFVSVRANPLADGLAREGLRRAAAGLRAAYADGTDLAAWTDMSLCSLLGGMALANAELVRRMAWLVSSAGRRTSRTPSPAPPCWPRSSRPTWRPWGPRRTAAVACSGMPRPPSSYGRSRRLHRGRPGLDPRDDHPAGPARPGCLRHPAWARR